MLDINPGNYRLILASKSPRRQNLLSQLGYTFTQISKEVEENYPSDLSPSEIPVFLSKKKAAACLTDLKEKDLLITSDTIVCIGSEVLEKAANAKEAQEMLSKLSGKTHQVITGVTLSSTEKQHSFSVTTEVVFKDLSNEEISYYISKYQPYDKAGAYGIQEWIGFIGVEKINGSYYNVMGLPLKELFEAIIHF
jgi:septum formation protein